MQDFIRTTLELLLGTDVYMLRNGDYMAGYAPGALPPMLIPYRDSDLTYELRRKGYNRFRAFVVVPGHGTSRWVIPISTPKAMRAATEIYQPHKVAPRIGKRIAAELLRLKRENWLGVPFLLASAADSPLEGLIRDVTGERQPLFALSFGRRPEVQKLTAQVLNSSGDILGYIKLPLTEPATARVMNEARVLEHLSEFAALRPHVPRLLHAGKWSNSYLLFQSPLQGQPGPTTISNLHEAFFEALWSARRVQRSGRSLVESVSKRWENAVDLLDSKWVGLGQEALRRAAGVLDTRTIECGITHGDFAPWNTRTSDGCLLVFDWESAYWDAPLLWDMFHFGLQTAASSLQGKDFATPFTFSGRATYLLYLLNSVIQFVEEKNPEAIEHRRRALVRELRKAPCTAEGVALNSVQAVETRAIGRHEMPVRSRAMPAMPRIVTTSWDDGDPRDRKIAELLACRGISGTFYIPMSGYLKGPTLSRADIRALAADHFEIGAHSVSHKSLTRFADRKEVRREVTVCKNELEQLIGKEVPMFCYPNGRYDGAIIREVQNAGYRGARTTRMLSVTTLFDPFEMPTTLQAYPHRSTSYIKDLGRARSASGLWRFTTELRDFRNWLDIGRRLFSQVLERGGIWHLYGHSWEIDEHQLWSELSQMLDHVAGREGVQYLTNSKALALVLQ
jgi:peptidoglycan/xylan/chitin deacetylase (PgdA/CDA1 family)